MIRVHVAIDSYLVRAAVATALRSQPGIEVVGETSDGDAGAAEAVDLAPDVIVLSEPPADSPRRCVDLYRAAAPAAKVVLLLLSRPALDLCRQGGAHAALDAGDGIDELADAVRSAASGSRVAAVPTLKTEGGAGRADRPADRTRR